VSDRIPRRGGAARHAPAASARARVGGLGPSQPSGHRAQLARFQLLVAVPNRRTGGRETPEQRSAAPPRAPCQLVKIQGPLTLLRASPSTATRGAIVYLEAPVEAAGARVVAASCLARGVMADRRPYNPLTRRPAMSENGTKSLDSSSHPHRTRAGFRMLTKLFGGRRNPQQWVGGVVFLHASSK
jgi:hypothetical protein